MTGCSRFVLRVCVRFPCVCSAESVPLVTRLNRWSRSGVGTGGAVACCFFFPPAFFPFFILFFFFFLCILSLLLFSFAFCLLCRHLVQGESARLATVREEMVSLFV